MKKKKKRAKRAWRRAALAGLAAGAYFLFKNDSKLLRQLQHALTSLLSGSQAAPQPEPTTSVPPIGRITTAAAMPHRTPTAENGHVRDVIATNPPPPASGSNFTPHNDVHGPQH